MPPELIGQTSDNFYTIVEQNDRYFDSIIQARGADNMKGTGYRPYLRWKLYWASIVDDEGSLTEAENAIYELSSQFEEQKGRISTIRGNWEEIGPFVKPYDVLDDTSGMVGVGRIHGIAFDPNNPNRIYAMTPYWGGLYRSDNSGLNWMRVQTDDVEGEAMSCIAVDNNDSQIIYLSNGDVDGNREGSFGPSGIYRTVNGGEDWTKIVNLNFSQRHKFIRKLVMDPNNSDCLFAATDFGLYKITNLSNLADTVNMINTKISDIEYKPGSADTIYACADNSTFLYRSCNDGVTWDSIPNFDIILNALPDINYYHTNIEVSASNPNLLYLLIQKSGKTALLYVYNTRTNSLVSVNSTPDYKVTNFSKGFAVSPINPQLIYVSDNNNKPIYITTDMGASWSQMPMNNYHIDVHHLDFSNTNQLWAATDGGVHRNESREMWTDVTNMNISNIGYGSFSVSQSDTNYVIMGCADDGTMMFDKSIMGSNKWSYRDGGDGNCCVFDPIEASIYYTSIFGGTITRHGPSSTDVLSLSPISGSFYKDYHSLVIDAADHNTIYLITNTDVYRSNQQGDNGSWECISNSLNLNKDSRSFFKLYTSETTPGVLYLHNWFTDSTGSYSTYYRTFNADCTNADQVVWEEFDNLDNRFYIDLIIDPRSPQCGWVALQGYNDTLKVMRFDEDGWYNRSYNLNGTVPGLASIAFDRMSNTGRLYAGTKEGVFYLDENSKFWTLFEGIPEADVTNLRIQYLSGKLYASTLGKGVWDAPISNPQCHGSVLITSDETISNGALSLCDIVVDSDVTLTITGCLTMGPETRIIVKRGAKLLVDGGTITGFNHQVWQGIEVWGDVTLPQAPASNQGWVKMINDALIEDARIAVATYRKDGTVINYDYTGGIVQANNTAFLNCSQDIAFFPFENTHPVNGNVINNVSAFGDCNFEVNQFYCGADSVRNLVSLLGISGVNFSGCKYIDNNKGGLTENTNGLYSFNSSFRVNSSCHSEALPCTDINPSEFCNLNYGIKALGDGKQYLIKIDKDSFNNNKRGIYISGINLVNITQNTFLTKTGNTTYPSSGIYLDNCTGYTVQENNIRGHYSSSYQGSFETGIVINNSGIENNEIYNNTFDSLEYGITAQNLNRSSNGLIGLVCKCNDYDGNKIDQRVLLSEPNSSWGIALYQGDSLSVTGPAGNTFSVQHWTNKLPGSDITNNGARFKYYHHHQTIGVPPRVQPQYNINVTVRPTSYIYSKSGACPSKLDNGGGISVDGISAAVESLGDSINQSETELLALVDGGSTEETTENIAYAIPDEALELSNDLLAKSPYLSDTVMQIAIANEYVLPNAMIRDILVANPHSATSNLVLDEIDKRVDPMPDDLYNEILEGESIISGKEAKENKMAYLKFKRDQLFNIMLLHYLSDSTNSTSDSLLYMLQDEPAIEAKYLLAFIKYSKGDTASMNITLESIPEDFELSPRQQVLHNNYCAFFDILINRPNYASSSCQPDSIQIISLLELTSQSLEPVKSFARNMLVNCGALSYQEPYLLNDEFKSGSVRKEHSVVKTGQDVYLKVYPNPANNYIIVDYNLGGSFDAACQEAILEITTVQGIVVEKVTLTKNQDQKVVSADSFKSGLYLAALRVKDKIIDTKKITIVKP